MSSCSLRHRGSEECFLWMKTMKNVCSLMSQKRSGRCGQDSAQPHYSPLTSPRLSQPVLLCPLVDRATERHQRAAERAVPCLCKSGNTTMCQHFLNKLKKIPDLWEKKEQCLKLHFKFLPVQIILDQEKNQRSGNCNGCFFTLHDHIWWYFSTSFENLKWFL